MCPLNVLHNSNRRGTTHDTTHTSHTISSSQKSRTGCAPPREGSSAEAHGHVRTPRPTQRQHGCTSPRPRPRPRCRPRGHSRDHSRASLRQPRASGRRCSGAEDSHAMVHDGGRPITLRRRRRCRRSRRRRRHQASMRRTWLGSGLGSGLGLGLGLGFRVRVEGQSTLRNHGPYSTARRTSCSDARRRRGSSRRPRGRWGSRGCCASSRRTGAAR